MKKNVTVLTLLASLLSIQACEPKKEKAYKEEVEIAPQVEVEKPVLSAAEKRVAVEKMRVEREEKRKLDLEERIKKSSTYTDAAGKIIYLKAEVGPSFIGGDDAMNKYLSKNIIYPKQAQENGVEGTVFVDFVVSENGAVREVVSTDAVGEDVDQSLRDEAIRVVTSMPKWKPGRQHGKPVEVGFSLPISFKLE